MQNNTDIEEFVCAGCYYLQENRCIINTPNLDLNNCYTPKHEFIYENVVHTAFYDTAEEYVKIIQKQETPFISVYHCLRCKNELDYIDVPFNIYDTPVTFYNCSKCGHVELMTQVTEP